MIAALMAERKRGWMYDYDRAVTALRNYQVRRVFSDPEIPGELPWWVRGCQPYRERRSVPSLPGESQGRSEFYAHLAHLLGVIEREHPDAARTAILYATPLSRWIDQHTREIRYSWRSYRQTGREIGEDGATVRFRVRQMGRHICRSLHDPTRGDLWMWRVKPKA